MTKQIIRPPGMSAPRGYSYAVKKTGTPVFISGQASVDGRDQLVGEGDAVTDAAYRPAVVAARQRHFQEGRYPASTYVVVSVLALPQLLVEIEAVAMID